MSEEKFKCLICEKECFAKGFGFHIKKNHNINIQQYYDMFYKKDDEGICLTCGKETKFKSLKEGYSKYCSCGCISKDPNIKKKKIEKSLEKYGTINVFQAKEVIEKCKQTCIEKFGVDNVFKLNEYQELAKEIKKERYGDENYRNQEKIYETNLEKYGCKNPLQNKEVLEKLKQTNIERYGVEFVTQTDKLQNSIKERWKKYNDITINKAIEENNLNVIFLGKIEGKEEYVFHCNECDNDFVINYQLYKLRLKNKHTICTHCNNPKEAHKSFSETQISKFIQEYYDGEILVNNREIIKPHEIDIYLPDIKLAIEFNGVFWHSELYRSDDFHLNKTKICEDKGIHLIHIYEDDWKNKEEIVKSKLLEDLDKSLKVDSNNCKISEIDLNTTKEFVEKNDLKEFEKSDINLGLFYNEELISLMIFKNKSNNYELLRFCNKLNITVVGGAEKLFKYFLNKYDSKEIVSYVDRSWTMKNGNSLYEKLGFILDKETKPNYSYVVENIRENRFKFRKDVLVKEGFDTSKTEHEIMLDREIYRIYDSGQLKFVYVR